MQSNKESSLQVIFNIQEAVADRRVMGKCGHWQHICQELPVLQADRWAFQHMFHQESNLQYSMKGERSTKG